MSMDIQPYRGIDTYKGVDKYDPVYIMQQAQRARELRETLEKNREKREKLQEEYLIVQQRQKAEQGETTEEEEKGKKGPGAFSILSWNKRRPATSGLGKFNENLSNAEIGPLLLVIVVLLIAIVPVYQGYTRLDLFMMVLSGDADLPIPAKGQGQNFQQAQESPPSTNTGNNDEGPWWLWPWGIKKISDTTTQTGSITDIQKPITDQTQTQPTTTTLSQITNANGIYPGGQQLWLD